MIPMKIDKCDTCEMYDHEKDCMRNELRCMFTCEDLIQYQTKQAAMYEAWCELHGIGPAKPDAIGWKIIWNIDETEREEE